MDSYTDTMLAEIELTKHFFQQKKIDTLYFGGGTPSQLSFFHFEKILKKLQLVYDLSALQEMTIEANPDDLTVAKIEEFVRLKEYGLNRFSIGVQSFFEQDLRYMNRAHRTDDALRAIENTMNAGFDKLTLDLIYGTPTLSDANWLYNLEKIKTLGIENFSAYALTVEPKTNLHQQIKKNRMLPPDDEQTIRQFDMLMDFSAANNFIQYEISNFARQGKYGIHNTNYWQGQPYLGLGAAAHSYDGTKRYINRPNIQLYMTAIAESVLPQETELLTEADKANEYLMTSLRTCWGCDLSHSAVAKYKSEIEDNLKLLNEEWFTINHGHLLLTKKGKHVADYIAGKLFVE